MITALERANHFVPQKLEALGGTMDAREVTVTQHPKPDGLCCFWLV